jgi:hypothetical protein
MDVMFIRSLCQRFQWRGRFGTSSNQQYICKSYGRQQPHQAVLCMFHLQNYSTKLDEIWDWKLNSLLLKFIHFYRYMFQQLPLHDVLTEWYNSLNKKGTLCKIWGFHGGDYEECCLLGCGASETSVHTRSTRRHIPEDDILQERKSYNNWYLMNLVT